MNDISEAKAGMEGVEFFGTIGEDGRWMIEKLRELKFPVNRLRVHPSIESGHTIIQLDANGEQAVILHFGANHSFTEKQIDEILSQENIQPGDFLLVQGETNLLSYTIKKAKSLGAIVIFNAAPYPPHIENSWGEEYPADWLFVNRGEAIRIIGHDFDVSHPNLVMDELATITSIPNIVLTLGSVGSIAKLEDSKEKTFIPAIKAPVVDTTGAGDVYLSYFLSEYFGRGSPLKRAMEVATCAAAIAISRMGALISIPHHEDVMKFEKVNHGP